MDWTELLQVSLATAAISTTTSKSKMFAWMRSRTSGAVAELVNCPYCTSHWVAALLVSAFPWTTWLVIQWAAVVALTSIINGAMYSLSRLSGQGNTGGFNAATRIF